MERGAGGEPNTVRYTYDERGFRKAAEYGGRVSSTLGYDAAGNLVRYKIATGAPVLSQRYEIGDYNEVVGIRTGEGPDVSFDYDSTGRLIAAHAGARTAAVAYDDLDRAVRVDLDGNAVALYAYAPADADAALVADRITSDTPVPAGTSAVFGTMESVIYTRPAPMDLGPVVYEPTLRTFVATHRHLVPDAVLASSLDRRMLQWRGGEVDGRPFGIDKPSGSLFVPPEYRSVNCFVCTQSLQSASVTVTAAPKAGQAFDVLLSAGGTCIIDEGGSQGAGFGAPVGPMWHHSVAFGDGQTTTGEGAFSTVEHTFASPGTYQIRNEVTCSPCLSVFVLGAAAAEVPVEDDCAGVTVIVAVGHNTPAVDIAGLTPGTQAALQCLRRTVAANGGALNVLSAYRSQTYQDHLREVWNKYQIVKDWGEERCVAVRVNVLGEWRRHGLNTGESPAERSPHSSGTAFDATWGTLNEGADIDDLARGCSLSRPLPIRDPRHFVHN